MLNIEPVHAAMARYNKNVPSFLDINLKIGPWQSKLSVTGHKPFVSPYKIP